MPLGTELACARSSAVLPPTIIGSAAIVSRYRAAAQLLGIEFLNGPEDAAALGLAKLGRIHSGA